MDEPRKNVPREPSDTQEWIRERFGDRPAMTDEERADAKDAQAERKRERKFLFSGEGRRAMRRIGGRFQGRD